MQTLWRGVLDMSHVEIETPAVEKKSSIARWFLVIPVVQIDRAGIGLSEKIVFSAHLNQAEKRTNCILGGVRWSSAVRTTKWAAFSISAECWTKSGCTLKANCLRITMRTLARASTRNA